MTKKLLIPSFLTAVFLCWISQSIHAQQDSLVSDPSSSATIQVGSVITKPVPTLGAYTQVRGYSDVSLLSPMENLQGRLPGTNIIIASGQPGGEISFQLRGVRSLAASNEPLYIIDGMPIFSDNMGSSSQVAIGPRTDIMSMFNPADIETITVLKDAYSKAIYGARGSNGVVVIKTKNGTANEPRIDLSVTAGFQNPIKSYDLLDGASFARYLNEANINAGLDPLYADPNSFGAGTNWQDETQRSNASVQDYQFRMSGGSRNTQYMLSAAYTALNGNYTNNDLRRYSLHANVTSRARSNLVISNSANFSRTDIATVSNDISPLDVSPGLPGSSWMFNPLLPATDDDGDLIVFNNSAGSNGDPQDALQTSFPLLSPVAQTSFIQSEIYNTRFTNYLSLDWELLDYLTLRVAGGIDVIFNEEAIFGSSALNPDATLGGYGAAAKLQALNWVNEYQLKYNRSVGNSGQIDALFGFSVQGYTAELLEGQSQGFENESLGFYNLSVGQDKSINSFLNEWQLVSFYTRIDYQLNERIHFGFTGRADASSKFYGEYAFFPALSAGYNIIRDNKTGFANALIARISYGWTGNSEISPYSTLSVLRQYETDLNGTRIAGFRPITLANGDLEIERTGEFNIGLTLGAWDQRLNATIDFFHQRTSNALVFMPQSSISGIQAALVNGATTTNLGVELGLQAEIIQGEFTWWAGFDMYYLNNEINALTADLSFTTGTPMRGIDNWSYVGAGSSTGSFFGYVTDGIVQTDDDLNNIPAFEGQTLRPGMRKYKDLDGNGVIDLNDREVIGRALPSLVIGFNNRFAWKGFDLTLFFQGTFGQDIANLNKMDIEVLNGQSNVTQQAYNDRWSETNASDTYPLALAADNPRIFSDAFVEEASYLRLRALGLGYEFSQNWSPESPVKRLRIGVQTTNLFTLTGFEGLDPDVSHFGQSPLEGGVDLDGYAKARQVLFNLQVTF